LFLFTGKHARSTLPELPGEEEKISVVKKWTHFNKQTYFSFKDSELFSWGF